MKKILLIVMFLTFATVAHAQTWTQYMNQGQSNQLSQFQVRQSGTNLTYTPLEPLYAYQEADINRPGGQGLASMLNNIFRLLITVGALVAVVTLVVGGVMYMTSEATNTKGQAKSRMQASIIGLILLAGSYLILNTIDPNLLRINLTPGAIDNTTPTPSTSGSGSGSGARTQVVVNRIQIGESVRIEDGDRAQEYLMNYNSQCAGAMVATERGAGYTTWTCQ